MTMQAFALLCALTTLACVSGAARASQLACVCVGTLVGMALLVPALLGLPWAPLLAVEPTQVALLLALFALARLRSNVDAKITLFIGGALAVVWLQSLRGVGWPLPVALPFVLCVLGLAAAAGLRREFFPPALQEEVGLLTLAGGLLVALVPGILEGWASAEALQGGGAEVARRGENVVWIAAGFVVLGAVFAWWKANRRWGR